MRSAKRTRWYCDFCSKSTGTKPSMEKHEKGCTANPNRVCGVCEFAGQVSRPLPELIAMATGLFSAIEWGNAFGGPAGDVAMRVFRTFAHGCPACMLATFRQMDQTIIRPNFRFDEEMKSFWSEYEDHGA